MMRTHSKAGRVIAALAREADRKPLPLIRIRPPRWLGDILVTGGARDLRRPRYKPMPARFNELADYNARKSQGVQYDPEYVARMADLQADFNRWQQEVQTPTGAR